MVNSALFQDLITYDALSETTRKERRALLGASMLGVALVKVPLVPEKFSAFGVDFEKVNQQAFVSLCGWVVAYFLAAFAVYAACDLVAWRRKQRLDHAAFASEAKERSDAARPKHLRPSGSAVDYIDPRVQDRVGFFGEGQPAYFGIAAFRLAETVTYLRAAFDIGLPIVFGTYAATQLFRY
jgi:hypothetical protein